MTSVAHMAPPPMDVRFMGVTLTQVRAVLVWLMFASSFYVAIEPAPADLLFIVVLACFLGSGLTLSSVHVPLILFLLLYNLGGFFSFLQVAGDEKARMFVITSFYMAASAVFFAFYVANNPLRRMAIIRNALIIAAVIASALGVLGYFNVAGLGSEFSLYWRAVGTFKDPNVFATYLLFPGVMLVQSFLLGTQRHKFISMIGLFIILAALFLAFSRGAWISFLFATTLMVTLTFILTPAVGTRTRIILITLFGIVGLAVLLAMLLSVEGIRDLFLDRFTFAKDYDSGEKGRFGNQLNSIPLLLEQPLGFGPLYFHKIFGQDPHNVYINAFASYGWLGGISYLLLMLSTITIGFKTVLMRTPWQNWAIVVFCPLLATIFQGVQIDTDHWRHFYWMLGMMWGLFAASIAYVQKPTGPVTL
ncbi:MAG TPA: O-antigen ligase family protein [Aestuariivirga sp.]|nr:O-antigen ligase family protein [Aestuariivirga sp.]HRA93445.1 O-antigen ligase family protein [Aestuariivirga sp.]